MTLEERIEAWPEQVRASYRKLAQVKEKIRSVRAEIDEANNGTRLVGVRRVFSPPSQSAPRRQLWHAYQEAQNEEERIRHELTNVKAHAEVEIRREAQEKGIKQTEAAIHALVKTHPSVVAVESRYTNAMEARQAARSALHAEEPEAYTPVEQNPQQSDDQVGPDTSKLESKLQSLLSEREQVRADIAYLHALGRSLQMLAMMQSKPSL